MTRRRTLALVLTSIFLFVSSCKTGAEAQKPGSAPETSREVVTIDKGLEVALADQPGAVFKFRVDKAGQLAPALRRIASLDDGRESQLLDDLADGNVFAVMAPMLRQRMAMPDGVDTERPIYISLAAIGGARYTDALMYGAALQPTEALPDAVRIRLVVPSTEPEATKAAFEQSASAARSRGRQLATRIDEDYVIADYLTFRPGLSELPEISRDATEPRQTPAYRAFRKSTAPMAVYVRTRDLLSFGGANMQYDMTRALESASPNMKQQMLAVGVAGNLNLAMISPPSEREIEDTCLEFRGNGEDRVSLTGHSTLTEMGKTIAAATMTDYSMPGALASDAETFVDARASFDLQKMTAAAPVEFAREGQDPARIQRSAADMLRESGGVGYAAFLFGSPTLLPRMAMASMPDTMRNRLPNGVAVGVVPGEDSTEEPGGAPFGFGASLFFPQGLDDQQATELEKQVIAMLRKGTAVDFLPSSEGTTMRLARRASLVEDATDVSMEGGRFWASVELAPLLGVLGREDLSDSLAPFTEASADVKYHEDTLHWAFSLGRDDKTITKTPEMTVDPQAVAPGCVGDVLAVRMTVFQSLGSLGPDVGVSDYESLLEPFDAAATKCAEAHPEYADRLKLGQARFGVFIARLAEVRQMPELGEAMYRRGCELGDQVQCHMLDE